METLFSSVIAMLKLILYHPVEQEQGIVGVSEGACDHPASSHFSSADSRGDADSLPTTGPGWPLATLYR